MGGIAFIQKFGRNLDIDAAEDLTDLGGDYPWLIAASPMTIESDDAADDFTGGDAAVTVRVEGLSDTFAVITEDVNLNGVAQVSLANNYFRINNAEVILAGAQGLNAGNILIRDQGSNVQAQITAQLGKTAQAIFTIPIFATGAVITEWWLQPFLAIAADLEAALMVRENGTNSWVSQELTRVRSTGVDRWSRSFDPNMGIRVPVGADIKIRVISVSAANSICSGGFDVALGKF